MKKIKIQVNTGNQHDAIKEWLEYFILTQLVKQLDISDYSKRLILGKTLRKKIKGDTT